MVQEIQLRKLPPREEFIKCSERRVLADYHMCNGELTMIAEDPRPAAIQTSPLSFVLEVIEDKLASSYAVLGVSEWELTTALWETIRDCGGVYSTKVFVSESRSLRLEEI